MKIWVGITDRNWYDYLSAQQPDEVNFWQPSGTREFRALTPGEPFLFKLHSPDNFIAGGGFFVRYTKLPCSVAWQAFTEKNGVVGLDDFMSQIRKYRSRGKRGDEIGPDPIIGCNILTEPVFFPEADWIPIPRDWARNIVQGKTYDTEDSHGKELWVQFQQRLSGKFPSNLNESSGRYGQEYLAKARLGQGAFRVLVTDSYHRRCAVTGERTLPVLEAAHIVPYARQGPNNIRNGLLLRADLHKLFDLGFVTVTPSLDVVVSKKIKEQYENGREYYAYHGNQLSVIPDAPAQRPDQTFLEWHNERVFQE